MNQQNLEGKTIVVGAYTLNVKQKLGEGGYASVYKCKDQQDRQYALKCVNCMTQERFDQFKQEAIILQSLPPHKNIVKLFAADLNVAQLSIIFLFEYCPTNAIQLMAERFLTNDEISIFFNAICSATAYLHSQSTPIIHRDLKPENLLVGQDGYPKLCDFGSATTTIYQATDQSVCDRIKADIERNTTQNYRAPEMIDFFSQPTLGPQTDIWALGCTLYKLIYRKDLFNPDESLEILQGRVDLPSGINPQFAEIICSCIQITPQSRPTAQLLEVKSRLLLSGSDQIAVMAKSKRSNSKPIESDNFRWYNYAQEQYRTWVSFGWQKWAIKATAPSNDPPKTKHIRRVILAAIKQTNVSADMIASYLINARPWQSDSRIASKVSYLILQLAQYERNLDRLCSFSGQIQQISDFYTQHPPTKKPWGETTLFLGNILKMKLQFHQTFPCVFEGNLAYGSRELPSNIKESISQYTKDLTDATSSFIQIITQATKFDNYPMIVMSQPAIDEVSHSYLLLKQLDESAVDELGNALELLTFCKQIVYLESSVEYPNESTNPPLPRFTHQSSSL